MSECLSFFDVLRVGRLLGENGVRLCNRLRTKNDRLSNLLYERRSGACAELSNTACNLSSL